MKSVETTLEYARAQDQADPLKGFRERFHFPRAPGGGSAVYFAGNSLGLQPVATARYIGQELEDWAALGVEGHLQARRPWLPYHEFLTESTARLVGAKPTEVVTMNSLTVNLHLMLVSFYQPTRERFKILIEGGAFPSDQYAVASQARFHGYDPREAIVELKPRAGEATLRDQDILDAIEREGPGLALILLGNVNYLTGQAFDIEAITRAGHAQGAKVGFDLAHGAGNLAVKLNAWGPDFAVWCSYKYLNAGPGAIAGCFVHERHARASLPRFEGWWGHDKATRFKMGPTFSPIGGAETWQLSNPPIFQLAALKASMDLFEEAGIDALRAKSDALTAYLERLLERIPGGFCSVVTPRELSRRGAQLSVRVKANPVELQKKLLHDGIICDYREPDILRMAPVPLYCSYEDCFKLAEAIARHA